MLTIALLASPLRQQKNKSLQHLGAHHDFSISLFLVQKEKCELEHCECAASSHLQCRWSVASFPSVCLIFTSTWREKAEPEPDRKSKAAQTFPGCWHFFFKAKIHFIYWQEIQLLLDLSNNALININHASPLHECANLREFCTLVTEIIKPRKWFKT